MKKGSFVASLLLFFSFSAGLAQTNRDEISVQAQHAFHQGDFRAAEKLYGDLIAAGSASNQARLGLSEALLKQYRLSEAIDQATIVLNRDRTSARAHSLI